MSAAALPGADQGRTASDTRPSLSNLEPIDEESRSGGPNSRTDSPASPEARFTKTVSFRNLDESSESEAEPAAEPTAAAQLPPPPPEERPGPADERPNDSDAAQEKNKAD